MFKEWSFEILDLFQQFELRPRRKRIFGLFQDGGTYSPVEPQSVSEENVFSVV
jgi:hypothetical protein